MFRLECNECKKIFNACIECVAFKQCGHGFHPNR
jgi:hypothetical protein